MQQPPAGMRSGRDRLRELWEKEIADEDKDEQDEQITHLISTMVEQAEDQECFSLTPGEEFIGKMKDHAEEEEEADEEEEDNDEEEEEVIEV